MLSIIITLNVYINFIRYAKLSKAHSPSYLIEIYQLILLVTKQIKKKSINMSFIKALNGKGGDKIRRNVIIEKL